MLIYIIYHSYGNSSAFSTLTPALYCHPPPTEPTRTPQIHSITIYNNINNVIQYNDSSIAVRVRIIPYIWSAASTSTLYITEYNS